MRIITGEYKGRHFDIPRTFKARPTTDFAKENIFNVLNGYIDFEGAFALELVSGTGSISLELVSRGCEQVVSVEADRDHHAFIKQCLKKLGTDRCIAIRGDVFRFVKSCRQQFDLIFADPPYALPELPLIPDLIMGTKPSAEDGPSASAQQSSLFTPHSPLLKPGGIFVFEHGKHNDFTKHPCFLEHRSYGSVNFSLFREAVPTSEQPIPTNV